MKITPSPSNLILGASALASGSLSGAVVLSYDSNIPSTNSPPAMITLVEQAGTDTSLVTGVVASATLGSGVTNAVQANNNQMNVTSNGNVDALFEFGSGPFNSAIATSLANGNYIGFSFMAAQDLVVDGFDYNLFVNNQSGSQYAARDSGLFYDIDNSGVFTQFASLSDQSGNGNRGTISFVDSFSVATGQSVELRLAFTDRTRSAQSPNLLTETTRIGSVEISATAVPEPSSALLLLSSTCLLGIFGRRR